ncbi:PEP-CTERM sorting domain-containing protein [Candidatus Binatia bacterium]|nr:PEP-CTERM sorting domain-containing protein [Candidatus Binatia bacterium]
MTGLLTRLLAPLAVATLVLVGGRPAGAVPIDFESLVDLEVVTGQFAGQGVTFGNTIALVDGSIGGSLNEVEFPPQSGWTVVSDDGGPMTLVFGTAVGVVSGYFTYNTALTLEAFSDTAGTISIGSISSLYNSNTAVSGDPGSSPNEFLQLLGLGPIGSVRITGAPTGGSFTMDDLSVDPVPEPGTLILVGSGLAAVWRVRRGRRSS